MLEIKPTSTLQVLEKGEEISIPINVTGELGTMTINSIDFNIFDSNGVSVDDNFNGGVSNSLGIITFGIKAYDVGKYKLEFIVTCVELLPDGVTPYEFIFYMYVKIKDT